MNTFFAVAIWVGIGAGSTGLRSAASITPIGSSENIRTARGTNSAMLRFMYSSSTFRCIYEGTVHTRLRPCARFARDPLALVTQGSPDRRTTMCVAVEFRKVTSILRQDSSRMDAGISESLISGVVEFAGNGLRQRLRACEGSGELAAFRS